MNDKRLSRLITQENLALRSENSQLKSQMEEKDSMLASKDGEIIRLLNQIASDMVKRSDVDEIVKGAVAEEHDRMVAFYEEKMKKMVAEYEAVIASLQKKSKGGNKGSKGSAGGRKKPNTETFATKEEAIAALEEAQKKALAMADQAFGGGSEKLTAEQKPAVDPQEDDADDDSQIEKPIEQRGNYGQTDYEPIPRAEEYCQDETGIARWFLEKIKLIYKFEKQYKKDRLSPETIKANRQTDILPILGDICQRLTMYAKNETGECGTLLMRAIHYAQAEWQGLMRYTTDGRYRPDNNIAEAIMRDIATGRKNFLFSGSDEAAKNLAFAYSLTQSCKLCNVNPYDYWEDLLTNAYNPNRTIDSFMPHLWRKM